MRNASFDCVCNVTPVAQLAEQPSPKRQVGGSIPSWRVRNMESTKIKPETKDAMSDAEDAAIAQTRASGPAGGGAIRAGISTFTKRARDTGRGWGRSRERDCLDC